MTRSMRDLYEASIAQARSAARRNKREYVTAGGAPSLGSSVLRLARLTDIQYQHISGSIYVAMYFLGFFVGKRAQLHPETVPETVKIYANRYPVISVGHDLNTAIPAFPLSPWAGANEIDMQFGQADVYVIWTPHQLVPEEDGGGRWEILSPLLGVCV